MDIIRGKDKAEGRRLAIKAIIGLLYVLMRRCTYDGSGEEAEVPFGRRPEEDKVELPFKLPLLAAIGYQASRVGAELLPSLNVEVLQTLIIGRVPMQLRSPDTPRVGWERSPLNHGILNWPAAEFRKRLRLSRPLFSLLVRRLQAKGYTCDNLCRRVDRRVTSHFKVAVGLMHLAYGGTWWQTGFSAGIAPETALQYTRQVSQGIIDVLRPDFMPGKPRPEELPKVQEQFKSRRGLMNVGGAVNGTHVPWQPDSEVSMEDFHNYKGWYSILCVAVVNSFYMFVDAEVGRPGRMSDSTATQNAAFFKGMTQDSEGWLGEHGILLSDGACGISSFIMTPYPGTLLTNKQQWFNFCFSSTRMYVEQVFGMWKSRWRVCIKEQQCSHGQMSLMIYATMVLHNMCQYYSNDPVMSCGTEYLEEWNSVDMLEFMTNFPLPRCKHCRENSVIHCVHRVVPKISVNQQTQAMFQRREELANQLWLAKCQENIDMAM